MTCSSCRHENENAARFCAQCGAPLTQAAPVVATTQSAPTSTPGPVPASTPGPVPASAPAPQPARGSKTALIVLGVLFALVLLLGAGVYVAYHMVASKVRTLTAAETQAPAPASDSKAQTARTASEERGAQAAGNAIGAVLGTDDKGKSDIGKALGDMAQTGRQIDQHNKASGNTTGVPNAADTQQTVAAVGGLLSALGNSLGGARRHDPVDFHVLQALLPSSLSGMQTGTPKGSADDVVGIQTTSAEVAFGGPNGAHITASIKDATAISGLAGLAGLADAGASEQGDSYEKNEIIGGRRVHEKWDAPGRHGELSLIVGQRFGVDVTGTNVDMDTLKTALGQIDLAKLESMKDANPREK